MHPVHAMRSAVVALAVIAACSDPSDDTGPADDTGDDTPPPAGSPDLDEFPGPFPSWGDVKARYGAAGDGVADDTAALQRALDEVGTAGMPTVVYLPAGTYRITSTLDFRYRRGVAFLGEDPDTTTIRWDGPPDGTMMIANGVGYARWGRITWDGAGQAGQGVAHQWDVTGDWSTTNIDHADERFIGITKCLVGGSPDYGINDAEVSIVRTRFERCGEAAVSIESFNALDYWIWDSEFDDCGRGVTNVFGAGNFSVYRSVFRGSTIADAEIGNTSYFTLIDNVSIGSRKFFVGNGPTGNMATVTLQRNVVIDPTDGAPVEFANLGPIVLLDNTFRTAGPAVRHISGFLDVSVISVGNTYTVDAPIDLSQSPAGQLIASDDAVVDPATIVTPDPAPVAVQPRAQRPVIEVAPDADGAAIQAAIDQAAVEHAGERAIVHLPPGNYPIAAPLVIGSGADVQLVGDSYATELDWTGGDDGTVVRIAGPSKATLRELKIVGSGRATGIDVSGADQDGGRIYAYATLEDAAAAEDWRVEGLSAAQVLLANHNGGTSQHGPGLRVVGPGDMQVQGGGFDVDAGDAYAVTGGGRFLARDAWHELRGPRTLALTGDATVTFWAGHIGANAPTPDPFITADAFTGRLTLFGLELVQVGTPYPEANVRVTNTTVDTRVLGLGLYAQTPDFVTSDGGGQVGLVASECCNPVTRQADIGITDPAFVVDMLAQVRAAPLPSPVVTPGGATDVRLYRLWIATPVVGVHVGP